MGLPKMFLISLIVTGVSFFFFFLPGFASNVWFKDAPLLDTTPDDTMGLWKICSADSDECGEIPDRITDNFAQLFVARLFACVAIILIVVHLVLLLLFSFKSPVKIIATVAYSCLLTAGILNFFGPVAYMSRTGSADAAVGWGGVLVLLSGIMQIVASILIIMPIRQGSIEFTTT